MDWIGYTVKTEKKKKEKAQVTAMADMVLQNKTSPMLPIHLYRCQYVR